MGEGGQRRGTRPWWVGFSFFVMLSCVEHVSAQIKYSIPEEVQVGSVVGNVAKDLGLDVRSLEERQLRIVSESEDSLFQINRNNGVLHVSKTTDREELCESVSPCLINLKMVAENPMEIHYVVVEIVDVNDNSPKFHEEEKILEIAESTLSGKRFQLPTARDPDVGANAVRMYKVNHNEYFITQIRERGNDKIPFLVLQKSLDREKEQEHRLILTAVDGGNPPRSGTLNVTIIVLDSNDNHPTFSQEVYSTSIPENVHVDTSVITVNATDLDEGVNGEIEYFFGGELEPKLYDMFILDKTTGEIRVKGKIDFEEIDVFKLDVHATDRGHPPMATDCRVIINVLDENDNKPKIEMTTLLKHVSEDSKPETVVALISVKDEDSGLNGKVICSVSDNVPFDLKPSFQENTYSVIVKQPLDREIISHFDVVITATDCGTPPLSSFRTLSIDVSDVNDNAPEFMQNPVELYLSENNVPGKPIFSVSASDKDSDKNAALIYHIIREESSRLKNAVFLNINSENGEISALKSFDFETLKTFHFQVVATDSGIPPLSSNVTVNVFILDQNDNAPVILYPVSSNGSAEGVEEIPRNVNVGHLVTKVRAYDADIGYNGWLLFSLQEVTDHSLFALDRYTGQIRTLRSFTETDEAEHKLVILVKDNGNVSLSATATVLVKLVEPKEAFAASDVKSAAKDDEDNNVTFYLIITLGSVSVLFIISIIVLIAMQCSKSTDYTSKYLQETNYDGTLCHSIQYRSGDKRYMLVGPRMSIGSTIVPGSHANTLVLPDRRRTSEEPTLAQIKYTVSEDVKVGALIGNVAKDLGLEASTLTNRRFRIVSGAQSTLFEVNPNNGGLFVHSTPDREEPCDRNAACLIDLKIIVENPLEVHYVTVEITDANDNFPYFTEKEKVIEIAETTSPGASFQLPGARDRDVGINSVQRYKLSQNEHFSLEIRDRGEDKTPFLVLQKSLDREQKTNHSLILTAVDGGTPSTSANLNLTIRVLDNNDNRPFFSQEVYSASLQENAMLDTIITKVQATDLDEGSNGDVEYAFGSDINSNLLQLFSLDRHTGEIRVIGQIDYEAAAVYKLDVQASDKGQPPMTTDCRVIIKIQDVNDNKPEIEVTSISNMVPEDSKRGTVVALISVTDTDSGLNGKVICHLTENVPFELKPSFKENMYSLVTKEVLDRESVSDYHISITATDCGEPPLSAFKTLSIQVSDVNDNLPEFSHNPLELYLTENNAPGASIFSVSASDKDLNDNAAVSYRIVRGEGGQKDIAAFLNINSENGHITALKSFDFERLKTFHFQVVATDSGTPSLSSNVTVNVFILDQNDNAPVILYPVSSNGSAEGVEEIPRNVNAGHLVTKVRAYDADIGYNGWLLFSLQEVTDHSLFALDRYTGQIRTLRSFTETDEAEHKLVILVKDNGNISLSATATVLVKLVEPKEAFAASDVKSAAKDDEDNNVTFYLMITLGSVSVLFIISIIVLIAMQCSKSTDYTSKYLQETNYDGTLCHSIQYRSGDKRYMLVGPRMSIGSTIVPGSHANTLVLPDRRRTSEEVNPF
ncbi:uncharacterized protein KZ484_008491 [Pholidichthys leucotaenia]